MKVNVGSIYGIIEKKLKEYIILIDKLKLLPEWLNMYID